VAIGRGGRLSVDDSRVDQLLQPTVHRRTGHLTPRDEIIGRQRLIVQRTQDSTGVLVAEQREQLIDSRSRSDTALGRLGD